MNNTGIFGKKRDGDPRTLSTFVSDVDDGGAGIACGRVFMELNRLTDNSCNWVVAESRRKTQAINASAWPSFISLMVFDVLRRLSRNRRHVMWTTQYFAESNVGRIVRRINPRVVCLHNIHQKMSFGLVRALPKHVPIVIYLHDMWYLTGYCCYSMGCDKFRTGCSGVCPQWGKWEVQPYPADARWRLKQDFYRENAHRIRIIAPSRWMARCAESRFGGNLRIEVIGNPIDCDVFRPVGEKRVVKQMLGFDPDKPLILCGAISMQDVRKGARYVAESLALLRSRVGNRFSVALFGKPSSGVRIPDAVWLGPIRDERLLNLYYNAATVFLLPSLAESFGMVYAEAMAAGTPCVAFDTTACGEIVREGETGFLAAYLDGDSLANALAHALEVADRGMMTRACSQHVVDHYHSRRIGEQHHAVIRSLLEPPEKCEEA